jgi:hypothetical protein
MNRIGMSGPGNSGFLKFTAALLAAAALASWSAGAGNPNDPGGRITIGSSGIIRWEADVLASIYVATDGGPEVLMAEAARGEAKPDWPHAGHVYRFVLRNTGDGRWLHSVTAEKDAYGRLVVTRETLWQRYGLPLAAILLAAGFLVAGLSNWRRLDLYQVVLVAAAVAVFSLSFGNYFFGDSTAQLLVRPRSVWGAFRSFFSVSEWYRPFSHSLLAYLLFPLFGNHHLPYQACALLLHIVVALVVYRVFVRILEDRQAAFVGAFFFALHPINFYTTYDNGFFADTTVALFYVLSAWCFFTRRSAPAAVLGALALFSKEAAVTLPLMLLAAILAFREFRSDWRGWVRRWTPMGAVWLAYLALYARTFSWGGGRVTAEGRPDYPSSVSGLPRGVLRFLLWSFQIPFGESAGSWYSRPAVLWLLAGIGLLVALFALIALAKGNLGVRAGLLWFFIAVLPMAALAKEFPHHLYLPLIGLALVIGELFAYLGRRLPGPAVVLLAGAVCLGHASLSYINVENDSRLSWVGGSALTAHNAVLFLNGRAGNMNDRSTIYVVNETPDDLRFSYLKGDLFRFSTGLNGLRVRIVQRPGQVPWPLIQNAVVATYNDKCRCLFDSTDLFARRPARQVPRSAISITSDGLLSWRSDLDVMVFVSADGGPEILMALYASGATKPDFLLPGRTYRFTLKEAAEDGAGALLDLAYYRKLPSGKVWAGKQPPPEGR